MFENIKAVIFDLDGTLIDTEKIYAKVWPQAVKRLGYNMEHEHYLAMRSLGRPFAPLKMKEWFGEAFDYDKARAERKILFDAYIKEFGIQKKPGVEKLLVYLKSRNIMTAIATATDIQRATEYLKMTGLEGCFDRVLSATMVDEGKPSPKVYQFACNELGFKPEECIAVEDAPNGIKSAASAGCNVIMVPDQSQPDEEINKLISLCVSRLDEICDYI